MKNFSLSIVLKNALDQREFLEKSRIDSRDQKKNANPTVTLYILQWLQQRAHGWKKSPSSRIRKFKFQNLKIKMHALSSKN